MAARRVLRIAERRALNARPVPAAPQRIGQWRVSQGLAPGSSGYGPLRDRPDWSFVDGRPAPLWTGQLRRRQENEELAVSLAPPPPPSYRALWGGYGVVMG
ncbi:39S ribosomal protein L52, mitochondrial [Meleagris gallopavo]|uniref:39S ribosomal protein L52, mitochondrial n=1 Tax=Meleagris gallopavo TaxID=9103 RepID=UPI000549C2B0|nr:39S ribosomal protein L52, mitochondrial [Meleagris gallopavo]